MTDASAWSCVAVNAGLPDYHWPHFSKVSSIRVAGRHSARTYIGHSACLALLLAGNAWPQFFTWLAGIRAKRY